MGRFCTARLPCGRPFSPYIAPGKIASSLGSSQARIYSRALVCVCVLASVSVSRRLCRNRLFSPNRESASNLLFRRADVVVVVVFVRVFAACAASFVRVFAARQIQFIHTQPPTGRNHHHHHHTPSPVIRSGLLFFLFFLIGFDVGRKNERNQNSHTLVVGRSGVEIMLPNFNRMGFCDTYSVAAKHTHTHGTPKTMRPARTYASIPTPHNNNNNNRYVSSGANCMTTCRRIRVNHTRDTQHKL